MTVPNIPFVVEAGYTLTRENTAVSTFWYFQIMGLAVHNLEVPLLFWRPQKKPGLLERIVWEFLWALKETSKTKLYKTRFSIQDSPT